MPSTSRLVALVAPALLVGLLAAPAVVRDGRGAAADPVLGPASSVRALAVAPQLRVAVAPPELPRPRVLTSSPEKAVVPPVSAPRRRPATAETARARPVMTRAKAVRAARVRPAVESAQAYADRRGRALVESFGYPVERLGWDIAFRPYSGSLMGTADSATRRITVYVRRGQSDFSLRVVLAHEVGHVVDLLTSTAQSRASYLAERGLDPQTPWYPCAGCSDYASPAGDFAEVFALWWAGPGDFRSRLAGPPPSDQLADLGLRFFQPPA